MQPETGALTLDTKYPIRLSAEQVQGYNNEIGALRYLANGLEHLNHFVEKVEREVQYRSAPRYSEFSFGNDPRLEGLPVDLVRCAFDWYSVSVCNYVRLVGWIHSEIDSTAPHFQEYIRAVVRGPQAWRDRVGAHFERAHNRGKPLSNRAMSMASVLRPIPVQNGYFVAGGIKLFVRASGKESDSNGLAPWSLTKTHAELKERYWPEPKSGE